MASQRWWKFWKSSRETPPTPADYYPAAYAINAMWVANHDVVVRMSRSRPDLREALGSPLPRPDEKVVPTIHCLKCQKRYRLLKDSYILSPKEIVREFNRKNILLIGAGDIGFAVSDKLQDVHFSRWHDTVHKTIRSIIHASQAVANGEAPKWTCRTCGKADNDFPREWGEQWSPSFESLQQKEFVIEQFRKYIEAEKDNSPVVIRVYLERIS